MNRKATFSLLGAVVAAAIAGNSQAAVVMNLDMRLAGSGSTITGGTGTQPAGVSADGKLATLGSGGIYQVEVWGQITDASHNWSNDAWTNFNWNVQSNQTVGGGALAGGGVTAGALASSATGGNANVPAAGTGITADGISDWGAATTTTSAGWINWQNANGSTVVGFLAGNTTAVTRQVPGNADMWEVLLATFTVDASTLHSADALDHQTAFQLGSMDKFRTSPTATSAANKWVLGASIEDSKVNTALMGLGGTAMTDRGSTINTGTGQSAGPGVIFDLPAAVTIPEPASVGVLVLGSLAILARRRKTIA